MVYWTNPSADKRAGWCIHKTHTVRLTASVTPFRWSPEKNEQLKLERSVSFEQLVVAVEAGALLDILARPNKSRYPKQKVLVVACDGYAYLVPFVEEKEPFFLKTVILSRKATRDDLGQGEQDAKDCPLRIRSDRRLRKRIAEVGCDKSRTVEISRRRASNGIRFDSVSASTRKAGLSSKAGIRAARSVRPGLAESQTRGAD